MPNLTTAAAINALWNELDENIPDHAAAEILTIAARQMVSDAGVAVRNEPAFVENTHPSGPFVGSIIDSLRHDLALLRDTSPSAYAAEVYAAAKLAGLEADQ